MNEYQKNEMLVEAEGLVKIYRGRQVVRSVSINVRAGEVVGLFGPNGAGKTTSFYMVMGLVRPDGGTVKFRGVDVTDMPMYLRARMGMGYLAQEPSIFRKLTVEENIMAILQTLDISGKERRERCEALMDDIADIAHSQGVNSAERLIKHDKRRICHHGAGDFKPPSFTA